MANKRQLISEVHPPFGALCKIALKDYSNMSRLGRTISVYSSYIWGTQYIDDLAVHNLSGATKYVALDHNSNCMIRLDSTGNAETRFLYDKYGNPTQRSADWGTTQTIVEDHYLFTGRQWHKDPLKYDFRNRDQDPELSSFIQPDPIGNWGDRANFGNRYTYVANDPANNLDPPGTQRCQMEAYTTSVLVPTTTYTNDP